jgi:hypothetical protein
MPMSGGEVRSATLGKRHLCMDCRVKPGNDEELLRTDFPLSPRGYRKPSFRHPEVLAISAFTRVFDALWRASKDDGPSASAVSFEGRFAATSG